MQIVRQEKKTVFFEGHGKGLRNGSYFFVDRTSHHLAGLIAAAILLLVCVAPLNAQPAIALFDGHSFAGWETMDGGPVSRGWEIVDGAIHLTADGPRAGNIITSSSYANYDLRFEWKIAAGGNSGIKYRVTDFGDRSLGCEYQILDDATHQQFGPKQMTGSLYALYEPQSYPANPAGEFNRGRIVVCGRRLQHWVNEVLVVDAITGSRDWHQRKSDSKFADVKGFGENAWGKIMLTDHNSGVWYRNLTLRELGAARRTFGGFRLRTKCFSLRPRHCFSAGGHRFLRGPVVRPGGGRVCESGR